VDGRQRPGNVHHGASDSAFEQKLEQLRHVYSQRTAVASANTEVIQKLTIQNADHLAEAGKAADMEGKIRSLLNA
jgi:hypothetical protein